MTDGGAVIQMKGDGEGGIRGFYKRKGDTNWHTRSLSACDPFIVLGWSRQTLTRGPADTVLLDFPDSVSLVT